MTNLLAKKSWSPYLVGLLIGILSWFAFATVDRPLGITTAFEHTAALSAKTANPAFEDQSKYFAAKREKGEKPIIGWEWMLVIGVFIGAYTSSIMSGDRDKISIPPLWQKRFGPSIAKRWTAAFLSAALMMFGARLAQGCTSGHGISGTLQLAVSSWIFISLAFAVAIATAFLMYGREGVRHV